MSNDTTLTIVGNLTKDPELKYTPAGAAKVTFTVASTPRVYDKAAGGWTDGQPLFLSCVMWREAAENAAESLARGVRVIATGRLRMRAWHTPEGDKRSVWELEVDEIGTSLRYAVARPVKTATGSARKTADATPSEDAWTATDDDDAPPF